MEPSDTSSAKHPAALVSTPVLGGDGEEDIGEEVSVVYGPGKWEASPQGSVLKTQELLRSGMTLNDFCYQYGLRSRRHHDYPNVILLKYQQLSAPFHFAATRECRGLVVDEDDNWRVLAYPYCKFFNAEEPLSRRGPQIDWKTARVYEKLDGSLATLYWYKDQWNVSSSGTPDGDALLADKETFAQMFWRIFKANKMQLPKDKGCCYVFEMIAKANPIVVIPEEDRIVLHGVRNLKTMKELQPEDVAKNHGWECVQSYPFRTLKEIEVACRTLNPLKQEGFVVVDANWQRRKVKCPQYIGLALMSIRDPTGNDRNMLQVIRQNESDEFLAYYPQWTPLYWYVGKRYKTTVDVLTAHCQRSKKIGNITPEIQRVEQAIASSEEKRDVRLAVKEWLCECDIKEVEEIMNQLSPVDEEERIKMLRKQKAKFEELGIEVKAKKKKRKNKGNRFRFGDNGDDEEGEPDMSQYVATTGGGGGEAGGNNNNNNNNEVDDESGVMSKRERRKAAKDKRESEWTVVAGKKGKGRRNNDDDELDRAILDIKKLDLKSERKKKGKK